MLRQVQQGRPCLQKAQRRLLPVWVLGSKRRQGAQGFTFKAGFLRAQTLWKCGLVKSVPTPAVRNPWAKTILLYGGHVCGGPVCGRGSLRGTFALCAHCATALMCSCLLCFRLSTAQPRLRAQTTQVLALDSASPPPELSLTHMPIEGVPSTLQVAGCGGAIIALVFSTRQYDRSRKEGTVWCGARTFDMSISNVLSL
jgi:hypothetical protein